MCFLYINVVNSSHIIYWPTTSTNGELSIQPEKRAIVWQMRRNSPLRNKVETKTQLEVTSERTAWKWDLVLNLFIATLFCEFVYREGP